MASASSRRLEDVGLWIFTIILAVAFVAFGSFKLTGAPIMIHEFDIIGLGQWFRYLTGVFEVGGAMLLLVPATRRLGALVVLCVSIGAFLTQALVLHGDIIHTLVLILLTGLMTWLAWKPIRSVSN